MDGTPWERRDPFPARSTDRGVTIRCSRTTRQRQPPPAMLARTPAGSSPCTRSRARRVPALTWRPRRRSRAWSAGQPVHGGGVRLHRAARALSDHGPDHRRERHRQGARRARDPPPLRPRQRPFVVCNCATLAPDAHRERAVRPRARRLHRRRPRSQGAVRGRRRRHHLPRRDRRAAARRRRSCCACSRSARSAASASPTRSRSTSASSPPPTATSATWCAAASSATTSTTG